MSGSSELPAPVALVTGATSGIGREVARKLAADGFSVLVHGRDTARGAEVVDKIINVGSMAGQIGLAGGAAYSATKAALASLTRSWAAEFSPRGVRVNTVAPGPAYTDGAVPERTAALGGTTLLGRAAEASEIAEVIAFLASPKAAYITGAVIAADGGRTAV